MSAITSPAGYSHPVSLLREMAKMLGCKTTELDTGVRMVFEHEGCWLSGHARQYPIVEVFLRTLDIPGFELRIDPRNAGLPPSIDVAPPAPDFRDHYEVDGNDDSVAELWLDDTARGALVDALWLESDGGMFVPETVLHGYRYRLETGRVIAIRDSESDPQRLLRAVRAAASLAARPHRIASAWLEVARTLGGTTTTDRWDLGKDFAVAVDRGPVEVRIVNLPDPLRTRVQAVRLAGTADDARDALEPVADLVAEARAHDVSVTAGEVSLTWRGMVMDPARLGPAVEICARLAAPSIAPTGPYR
jgi:hypothetical protein